jgi:hypothetical protein
MERRTSSGYSSKIIGFLIIAALSGQTILGASLTAVTSCTVDGLPVACSPGNPNSASALFFASPDIGGPDLGLTVAASAAAGLLGNTTGFVSIDLTFYAKGAGPVRPGLAKISVGTDGDGTLGGATGGSAHASVADLISCTLAGPCFEFGDFPLMLGVPFQIKLQASAFAEDFGEAVGFSTSSSIQLSLFEFAQDGSLRSVNILGPVVVPEPNQFGPALLAALAGIVWRVQARRKAGLQ